MCFWQGDEAGGGRGAGWGQGGWGGGGVPVLSPSFLLVVCVCVCVSKERRYGRKAHFLNGACWVQASHGTFGALLSGSSGSPLRV
ncbi:hypothetical protein ACU4GD_43430 [Cupriavidus basilensis]